MEKIKVGIFFGGPSREREISFAGGRTVYDNLNKSIFEPIPIFIDSNKKFILLDWKNVYKGSIRDFYPPVSFLEDSPNGFQVYIESLGPLSPDNYAKLISEVGTSIETSDLPNIIDFAFLALHGVFGEDGQIQSLLDMLSIPYSGSGVLPCALGMDKSEQKKYMEVAGFNCPTIETITRTAWINGDKVKVYSQAKKIFGQSLVIRPANQGSSIGVSILQNVSQSDFISKVNKAFFILEIEGNNWLNKTKNEKVAQISSITDIREGIGFPMKHKDLTLYHPEELYSFLEKNIKPDENLLFEGYNSEAKVILESFLQGKEFSCIVLRNADGSSTSLPPTEIRKQSELYDYKSKYLPGLSRKITPIDLPHEEIEKIRLECAKLYDYLGFNTYARIDGFYTPEGKIFLNDPNTTSGMMPSSFFFHQAAEIGLNPSQFLSYIIWASIKERKEKALMFSNVDLVERNLNQALSQLQNSISTKIKVGVILGGYSFERHISVESGRNIYEKLASSEKYEPIPIFLLGLENGDHDLYQIPINLLLKDNADDIRDKILHFSQHSIITEIQDECEDLSKIFSSKLTIGKPVLLSYPSLAKTVDVVFIALHGRPGEDGNVQKKLIEVGLPFNGSPSQSASLTINKYETLQTLKKEGFTVTDQLLLSKSSYLKDGSKHSLGLLEDNFSYPLIAKPVDDGCSSAVVKIKDQSHLKLYLDILFRDEDKISDEQREQLGLAFNEEFPLKNEVLIEALISSEGCKNFLEITGGLLTHSEGEKISFEMFEPSEALSSGEVLSLEEKFLAGEGQNITPARFAANQKDYATIAEQVKSDLKRAAQILGVEGYARIDAFVRINEDLSAETIIIEVNSLPGMTPATCIFHQCALNGYKPYEFIDKILTFALNRNGNFVH